MPRSTITAKARRGQLTRVATGVYDVIAVPPECRTVPWARQAQWSNPQDVFTHLHRRSAILALLSHPAATATGLSALALHNVRGLPRRFTPSIGYTSRGPERHQTSQSFRRYRRIQHAHTADGWRVSPLPDALAQGLLDLVPQPYGDREAMAMLDDVIHRSLLTPSHVRRFRECLQYRRGAGTVRGWAARSRSEAESPAESWARQGCYRNGCPPDRLQLTVLNQAGGHIARVDMAWLLPSGGLLLVEIDGTHWHSLPRALVQDAARQNQLVTLGTLLRFTGRDAWHETAANQVSGILSRSGWVPGVAVLPPVIMVNPDARGGWIPVPAQR